ncbi:hypothetical protein V6N13_009994 [Hibiscus sabdariffa]
MEGSLRGRPPDVRIGGGDVNQSKEFNSLVSSLLSGHMEEEPNSTLDRENMGPDSHSLDRDAGLGDATLPLEKTRHALSFRDTLIGNIGYSTGSTTILELDVDVRKEDVKIGGGSSLPEIWRNGVQHHNDGFKESTERV